MSNGVNYTGGARAGINKRWLNPAAKTQAQYFHKVEKQGKLSTRHTLKRKHSGALAQATVSRRIDIDLAHAQPTFKSLSAFPIHCGLRSDVCRASLARMRSFKERTLLVPPPSPPPVAEQDYDFYLPLGSPSLSSPSVSDADSENEFVSHTTSHDSFQAKRNSDGEPLEKRQRLVDDWSTGEESSHDDAAESQPRPVQRVWIDRQELDDPLVFSLNFRDLKWEQHPTSSLDIFQGDSPIEEAPSTEKDDIIDDEFDTFPQKSIEQRGYIGRHEDSLRPSETQILGPRGSTDSENVLQEIVLSDSDGGSHLDKSSRLSNQLDGTTARNDKDALTTDDDLQSKAELLSLAGPPPHDYDVPPDFPLTNYPKYAVYIAELDMSFFTATGETCPNQERHRYPEPPQVIPDADEEDLLPGFSRGERMGLGCKALSKESKLKMDQLEEEMKTFGVKTWDCWEVEGDKETEEDEEGESFDEFEEEIDFEEVEKIEHYFERGSSFLAQDLEASDLDIPNNLESFHVDELESGIDLEPASQKENCSAMSFTEILEVTESLPLDEFDSFQFESSHPQVQLNVDAEPDMFQNESEVFFEDD